MTRHFSDLKRALEQLRRDFLPAKLSATGHYSSVDIRRTLAYRVLVCAEIERYVEESVWDIALAADQCWVTSNRVSKTAMAILGFSGLTMEEAPRTAQPPQTSQANKWPVKIQIGEKLKIALNCFHRTVDNNHGMKEQNLLRLLLPIGIEVSQLDPLWLTDMDSYGAARGIVAHHGVARCSAQQLVDPATELHTVESLVKGLEDLDRALADIRRRLR